MHKKGLALDNNIMAKISEEEYDRLVTEDFLEVHGGRLDKYTRDSYQRMVAEKDYFVSEMGREDYDIVLAAYEEILGIKER